LNECAIRSIRSFHRLMSDITSICWLRRARIHTLTITRMPRVLALH